MHVWGVSIATVHGLARKLAGMPWILLHAHNACTMPSRASTRCAVVF